MNRLIRKMKLTESMRNQTFYEYCLETLGEEDALQFVHVFGFHEPYYKNAYDMLQSLHLDFLKGDFYVLKEGLSVLCEKMLEHIQGKCILNHRVTRIEHVGNHVEVDGYKASRVMVTIPPTFFKYFPILSPYNHVISRITQGPLLRIYAKYPYPVWFKDMPKLTTSHTLRHLIPIHDGVIMIAYVEDMDLLPFVEEGKIKSNEKIGQLIETELSRLFPSINIPKPLWIRPYVWNIGTHACLPGMPKAWLDTLPKIEKVHVCGEAFSMRQSWIEGALESVERVITDA
jgi:monoamine oxidase